MTKVLSILSVVPDLPPKQSKMSSASRNSTERPHDNQSANSSDTESYVSNIDLDASMPSHAYREIRGLPSNNVLKQNMRRTLKERRPKTRGKLDQTDGFSVDNEAVVNNEEQVFQGVDLSPEEYSNLMGRQRDIKDMPTSIKRKRSIKLVKLLSTGFLNFSKFFHFLGTIQEYQYRFFCLNSFNLVIEQEKQTTYSKFLNIFLINFDDMVLYFSVGTTCKSMPRRKAKLNTLVLGNISN